MTYEFAEAGAALVASARVAGAHSIAVVGTSKNAGKTVAVGGICEALERAGERLGFCSIGRDGEAADALDGAPKPRFFLREGVAFATASSLVPRSPAAEITSLTAETTALGPVVLGRVRAPGFIQLAGPPSAAAVRRVAGALAADGRFVVLDGAVDRIAVLRDGDDAIVVAVGAAGAPTMQRAVNDVAALVGRLALRRFDPSRAAIRIEGALTAVAAAAFAHAGERRQIVVRDGTHVAFGGSAFSEFSARLDLRCERELRPLACTVAPRSAERSFPPRAFACAVAARTGLPAYDFFAGTVARPPARA